MKYVFLLPSYLHVPGSKFRRHGHLRLPLTMLAVASLALSSLLFLAPIPVQAAPPVAVGDEYDIDQNSTLNVPDPGVLVNDTDPDGDPFTAHLVSDVGHGTLALNANGSFSYTPDEDWNGTDSFTYEAHDNEDPPAVSPVATVTITVNAAETYMLTISSTSRGRVDEPGEGSFGPYEEGAVVELVANPNFFWQFAGWTGDVSTVDDVNAAETFITMNGNYSITANFARDTYTLTIGSSGGGSVTDPGEGDFVYGEGQEVHLVAEASDGYAFTGWTGDVSMVGDVNAADTTIIMEGDYSIRAEFTNIRYTLTIEVGDSGGGTTLPTPGVWTEEYVGGEEARVEAIPETGYRFDRWEGDVEGIDPSSNRIAFIMNSDHTITAHFAQQYSLTIDVSPADDPATPEPENLGWPNLDIGTHWYDPGEEVEFSAIPESGCQFDRWTGDVGELADPNAASATIIMNGNYSFTANFSRLPPVETFFLYVSVVGEGSTNPEAGRHYFDEGELINIAATPADGWAFGGWTSEDEDAVDAIDDADAAQTTITMNYNYPVTANFVQGVAYDQMVTTSEDTPVEITLTASNLGGDALTFSIVDAPAHGRLSGAPPNLTYTPDEGYTGSDSFSFSVDDGTNDSNTATVTITVEAAGTGAESDPDGMGVPTWVWILLAGGSIAVGAITLLVIARRSAATE